MSSSPRFPDTCQRGEGTGLAEQGHTAHPSLPREHPAFLAAIERVLQLSTHPRGELQHGPGDEHSGVDLHEGRHDARGHQAWVGPGGGVRGGVMGRQ